MNKPKFHTMQNFNKIEWLNSYFPGKTIKENDIKNVLYFSLMWNLFELRACKKHANTATIADAVNQAYSRGVLLQDDFDSTLLYFRGRYAEQGTVNLRFNKLEFRKGDKKELVASVLEGHLDDLNNIVFALLLIVLRLRNNLFHGEKDAYSLNYQAENFGVANHLLATFLDCWKRC